MPLDNASADALAQQIWDSLQDIGSDNVGGIDYLKKMCRLIYSSIKADIMITTAIPVTTTGSPTTQAGVVTGTTPTTIVVS